MGRRLERGVLTRQDPTELPLALHSRRTHWIFPLKLQVPLKRVNYLPDSAHAVLIEAMSPLIPNSHSGPHSTCPCTLQE